MVPPKLQRRCLKTDKGELQEVVQPESMHTWTAPDHTIDLQSIIPFRKTCFAVGTWKQEPFVYQMGPHQTLRAETQ